ncbi:hypothetical protein SI65_07162 [Aspergillus cristatus]|uniref:Uncharacterized protein n=1 Tax=Aspergillus cristatus TaxID=573508 RepID=A0A1E3B967_ASPCR|nr:hypothetical protein SI65_07162 [Aspergillus cristatus]
MSDQQDMPVREVNRTANSMPALTGLPLALYSLKPDYSPGWYEQEPKWEAFPMNELEKVTEELEQHVRRLVPGFLKGNEAVLKKKEFKDRLSARTKTGSLDLFRMYSQTDSTKNGPERIPR